MKRDYGTYGITEHTESYLAFFCLFRCFRMFRNLYSHRRELLKSELESRHDLAVTLSCDIVRIDETEPAGQFTGRVSRRCRSRTTSWHRQEHPVKRIENLHSDFKIHPLPNSEFATEIKVLYHLPLPAVVVIEPGRVPEIPGRRV